jgi:MFS family permease
MNKKPFLVIFLTVFMDLVGFGIIIPLNPFLARQFGADPLQVGLLMTIYSLFQLIFSPVWGQLSDRWGRRPIILVSVLGAGVSHLIFGFAGTLFGLFIARGLAGLFGGNISAAMAAMADLTPPKERSKGMGIIGAAFGLGFILGPFLGGIFAEVGTKLGSEPPFGGSFPAIVAAGICFANFALAYFILPETHPVSARSSQTKRPPRWAMLLTTWRKPVLGSILTVFFLTSLAMAHMEASLFLLVQDRFQWGMTKASMGFAYVGVMIAFTQGYLIRKTLPKWGEAKSFLIGLVAMGAGFFGIAIAQEVWVLAIAVTALAVGNGFANPALLGSVSLLSPAESQGGHLGVNQSLSSLGRILGPALGGLFYREFGMSTPFLAAGGLVILGLIIGYGVRLKLPKGAAQ